MEDLPPHGSPRRRIVIGIWVALTILFAALLVCGIVLWTTGRAEFPILAAIGGVGGFIALWRWILERSRSAT